jgi:hypothetical protein
MKKNRKNLKRKRKSYKKKKEKNEEIEDKKIEEIEDDNIEIDDDDDDDEIEKPRKKKRKLIINKNNGSSSNTFNINKHMKDVSFHCFDTEQKSDVQIKNFFYSEGNKENGEYIEIPEHIQIVTCATLITDVGIFKFMFRTFINGYIIDFKITKSPEWYNKKCYLKIISLFHETFCKESCAKYLFSNRTGLGYKYKKNDDDKYYISK